MIARDVVVSPRARSDLSELYDRVAAAASPNVAWAYLERVEAYLRTFDLAPERGRRHDEVRRGLRVTGFERRLSVAFIVEPTRVVIVRIVYGGRDWASDMDDGEGHA